MQGLPVFPVVLGAYIVGRVFVVPFCDDAYREYPHVRIALIRTMIRSLVTSAALACVAFGALTLLLALSYDSETKVFFIANAAEIARRYVRAAEMLAVVAFFAASLIAVFGTPPTSSPDAQEGPNPIGRTTKGGLRILRWICAPPVLATGKKLTSGLGRASFVLQLVALCIVVGSAALPNEPLWARAFVLEIGHSHTSVAPSSRLVLSPQEQQECRQLARLVERSIVMSRIAAPIMPAHDVAPAPRPGPQVEADLSPAEAERIIAPADSKVGQQFMFAVRRSPQLREALNHLAPMLAKAETRLPLMSEATAKLVAAAIEDGGDQLFRNDAIALLTAASGVESTTMALLERTSAADAAEIAEAAPGEIARGVTKRVVTVVVVLFADFVWNLWKDRRQRDCDDYVVVAADEHTAPPSGCAMQAYGPMLVGGERPTPPP
jgi:hypothetical protein